MSRRLPLLLVLGLVLALLACSSPDGKLRVTGFDKNELEATGGTYLKVTGTGFTGSVNAAKVWFAGQPGTVIRFETDTEMIVQAPGCKPGDVMDVLFKFE